MAKIRKNAKAKTQKKAKYYMSFQMLFHQTKHHLSKVIIPDIEGPWFAEFKTTITFEFMTYSSPEKGLRKYFTIPPKFSNDFPPN